MTYTVSGGTLHSTHLLRIRIQDFIYVFGQVGRGPINA